MIRPFRRFRLGVLAALLFALAPGAAVPARADSGDDVDDVLGGFADDSQDSTADFDEADDVLGGFDDDDFGETPDAAPVPDRFWDLTGSASLGASFNYLHHEAFIEPGRSTDYFGIQRLRTRLNLQLDLDLPSDWKFRLSGFAFYDWAYLINGRDDYTDDVLKVYEWEVDFQEVWFQGPLLDDLDIKVGRQVVNWGRSDSLRVLDVLNPLDNREPGLTDIEDLRRPVAMVKADYYLGDWSLSLISIPEMRFDLNPPIGSDFAAVFSGLGSVENPAIPSISPKPSFKNTEWAARLQGIFSGWDVSFHYANYWNDQQALRPVVSVIGPPPFPPEVSFEGTEARHSRLQLVGAGGNYTLGSWLFKSEFAWVDGTHYTTSSEVDLALIGGSGVVDIPTGTVRKGRLDYMAGVEYYGFNNTSIALEIVNRHILDYQRDIRPLFGIRKNSVETALRITRNFMNERLEVTVLGILFGTKAQDGSVIRLDARYDILDALELGGGILLFQKGDRPPFDTIAKNDRIFLELKYSF